jgi:hypothetical protein
MGDNTLLSKEIIADRCVSDNHQDEQTEKPGTMKARAIARVSPATLIQYPSYDKVLRVLRVVGLNGYSQSLHPNQKPRPL